MAGSWADDVCLDVLRAACDAQNPLFRLEEDTLATVLEDVRTWWRAKNSFERTPRAFRLLTHESHPSLRPLLPSGRCEFPASRSLNVNMMPFELRRPRTSLPPELQPYCDMIFLCRHTVSDDRIAYLTVHESDVPVGQSQRRAGLHVESPGGGYLISPDTSDPDAKRLRWGLMWGMGALNPATDMAVDGIFMASNLDATCRIWPALIKESAPVTDPHGGVEQLREHLGPGQELQASQMCWFTDRTPHESLPVQAPAHDPDAKTVHRQFFRLVVGKISVWYTRHSTPNPLGVQPDATISHEDRFAPSSNRAAS
jgi:hypothetical protein